MVFGWYPEWETLLDKQNYYCSSANNFLILYIIINQYPYLNNASTKISL